LGAVVALVLGLTLYPPVVLGGAVGACVGAEILRRSANDEARDASLGRTILVAGLLLTIAAAVGELLGLGEERREFLRMWREQGLFHLDFSALARYPWAWVPQTAGIAALTAGALALVRGR